MSLTACEVEAFQAEHHNHLGKALRVDGVLGPQTQWSLDFETLCKERRAIVAAAQAWIGLEEQPARSNSEPTGTIRGWLARCNAPGGAPWCAAFASFCLGSVRIEGAQALGRTFPPTLTPMAGDLMWYPTVGWQGHCGVVIGVSSSEVMTIEGNLRGGVRAARRPRVQVGTGVLRFARPIIDTTGACPGVVPSVSLASGGTR